MRRWFARRYNQPPNSPLFAAETITYWRAHMLLDCQGEAKGLADQLGQTPPQGVSRAYTQWRAQAMARLQDLYGMLGEGGDAAASRLREDQEAAARGELPSWLKERLVRGEADGDGRD